MPGIGGGGMAGPGNLGALAKGPPKGATEEEKKRYVAEQMGQAGATAAKVIPYVGKIPGISAIGKAVGKELGKMLYEHREFLFAALGMLALITLPLWILPALILSPLLFFVGVAIALWWSLRDVTTSR